MKLKLILMAAFAAMSCLVLIILFFVNKRQESLVSKSHYRSILNYPLNAGLPTSLNPYLNESKDTIFLLIHLPNTKIDYTTPATLRDSLLGNGISQIDIGHVQLAWSCKVEEKLHQSAFGFTGELNGQTFQMLRSGWGATALFATHNDGFIEGPYQVEKQIRKSFRKNKLFVYKIDAKDKCKKVLEHVTAFIKSPISKLFNLSPRHSQKRDAHNCTSIVVNLLKPITNLEKELMKISKKEIVLPQSLFGFSKDELPNGTSINNLNDFSHQKKVGVNSPFPVSWLKKGNRLFFYDPTSMSNLSANFSEEVLNFKL